VSARLVAPEIEESMPAAHREKKAQRKAAATKHFPYGFGPATSTRFVIEEIGETSDDQENLVEYQENQAERFEFSSATSWFDEYQTVRKAVTRWWRTGNCSDFLRRIEMWGEHRMVKKSVGKARTYRYSVKFALEVAGFG
jgi:hypothetical protein